MSATLVTQCPYCQTRFRLSQEHLRAAAGNVRCGACLKVFNANPPATDEDADAEINNDLSQIPGHQPRTKARLDDVLIHDDLELDDLDLEDLGLDESIIDEVNPSPQQSSLPLTSAPLAKPEPETGPQLMPAPQAPLTAPEPAPAPQPTVEAQPTLEADFEPDWMAEDVADQMQPADDPASTALPVRESDKLPGHEDIETLPDAPQNERPESDIPVETLADTRREPLLGDDFILPELDTEALLMDDQPINRPHRRNVLWSLLSLLAVLALIGQFGYFNFAVLSHDERSRSVIASWCNLTGCELPPRVDISLIRSSNLTVRAHPEYPNTLAIDVILYNRADFAQPFPVLRMRFTDQSDREVASRLFRPQEYLGGELAGARLMPAQTPIHVGLSMLAPDQAGSSYRLDFLSPEH